MADFPTELTIAVDNTTDVLAKHVNNLEAKVGVDDSAVATSLDFKLGKKPTELKVSTVSKGGSLRSIDEAVGDVARTTNGWIEDEKYGWFALQVATAWSAEFDSAVTRTGKFTLKLEAVDVTGTAIVYNTQGVTLPILAMEAIPLKVSTVYRLNVWVKTNLVGADGVYADVIQYDSAAVVGTTVTTSKLSITNNWTLLTVTFTSDDDAAYGRIALHNDVAGAVNQAWFDVNSMTLEEIVVDTSFTGKNVEKIRPVLQAVTSTDSVDQVLDTAGAYSNTYALTNAINEGATHIQTFTPTKKYTTQIGVWVVEAGTGVDWYLYVHDASNQIIATGLISAASLVEGAFNYFDVPNIWASGALHFHLYASATTGTPTCKVNTTDNLETASFVQRYAKKSENFTVVANGIKTELKADKDGLFSDAIIDLDNGKYWYDSGILGVVENGRSFANNVFSADFGDSAEAPAANPAIINGYSCDDATNLIKTDVAKTNKKIVMKCNTLLPIQHLLFNYTPYLSATISTDLEISSDGVNYTTLIETGVTGGAVLYKLETDIINGLTSFYLRFNPVGYRMGLVKIGIEADLDTSKIPSGLFYPLAVNQFTETVKLPATVDRVYFQSAKYTNEYGVVVPALEFCTTAVPVGYVPLKLDNSQETSPCVSLLSTTTNYQQSGTGSAVTDGYVLNTGEYMTLTSAVDELKVDYQVGTGTDAISAITKNTLFLSSNGESVDSTQDPSHQMTAVVGVRQQGLVQRVGDLGEEIAKVRKDVVKSSVWTEWTPTLTWTTGTPEGSVVTKARYKIVDGVCHISFYYSATDGNGAINLTITLPVAPKNNGSFIKLSSQQLQNETWSDPLAYLDDSQAKILFGNLITCTDAEAVGVIVTGSYEI
jgi:hypothetical protein